MRLKSLVSAIIVSYFAPFIAFFISLFFIGLDLALFSIGIVVVSFMTLFLYLRVKKIELDIAKEITNEKKIKEKKAPVCLKQDAFTKKIIQHLFTGEKAPTFCLPQASDEHLQERFQEQIQEQMQEREILIQKVEKLQDIETLLEKKLQEKEAEIENLTFEVKTLLKMDDTLLSETISLEDEMTPSISEETNNCSLYTPVF